MTPPITLLTDFGTADGYVGEVKGVLSTLAPHAPLVDISHDLYAQDVEGARLAVARYWRRFPPGTVHLVIVDPGVGTARAALAVASEGRYLVGPDNGVLSPSLFALDARVVRLAEPPAAAPTFHGRDVFAPVAAQLAMGGPLEALGEPHPEPVRRRTPPPVRHGDGTLEGEVLTFDRFGNAVTNLVPARPTPPGTTVVTMGQEIPLVRTYGDVPPGAPLALVGSSGLVEIAVRNGSAASRFGMARGQRVVLTARP
ncbi:MAG: SAM-dependent chlorinase/fluorinase [Gemmatimonadetes bacterium]|nr:SAM-dependent chlorinase/fluorinase [Gemmatimonadota bacterium]